ncbi:cystatin-like [Hemicordylus capensis]|uniref:cystatin-like n=1 Tax=Hemicordylus capensis TaxID=884348 RepID=UPI0023036B26|nr:cystatin-like [Hemicordylus capensis]
MASFRWLLICSAAALVSAALAADRPRMRLLGGPSEVSTDNQGAQQALKFAMSEYNKASNDMYLSRVSEVVGFRQQIVSGIKYFLDVKVGRTKCTKSSADIENCAFHETPELAQEKTCRFVVHTVLWLNQINLLEKTCH